MSASERLRELDAATPLEKYEIDLFRVLPEIVAVVEAAEFARDNPHMPSDLRWEDFDAAHAALEEKLK